MSDPSEDGAGVPTQRTGLRPAIATTAPEPGGRPALARGAGLVLWVLAGIFLGWSGASAGSGAGGAASAVAALPFDVAASLPREAMRGYSQVLPSAKPKLDSMFGGKADAIPARSGESLRRARSAAPAQAATFTVAVTARYFNSRGPPSGA